MLKRSSHGSLAYVPGSCLLATVVVAAWLICALAQVPTTDSYSRATVVAGYLRLAGAWRG